MKAKERILLFQPKFSQTHFEELPCLKELAFNQEQGKLKEILFHLIREVNE